MNSVIPQKKIIKRELAELKLALAQKKKKLEKKQTEQQIMLLERKKKMQHKLLELEAVFQEKNNKLENKISRLENEIANEKNELLKAVAIEQHDAIDHLETYLEEVDHKYAYFRGLWKMIRKEFKDIIRNNIKARKQT
ncbi:MAG: hypothetical protein JXA04_07840 [Gammaproteobacteria bacterium]|nr:hypothetical protein [Gammaproteobacteria bacterium]